MIVIIQSIFHNQFIHLTTNISYAFYKILHFLLPNSLFIISEFSRAINIFVIKDGVNVLCCIEHTNYTIFVQTM